MKFRLFLGVMLFAMPAIALPTLSQTQTDIGDLQQVTPGVTVSGRVVSVVGNDFVLEDSTGQIIVDAGPRWWQQINLTEGEQLTVTGEVGRGGEIDAFSITRADGSVINIRPASGPPPWAGNPNRRSVGQ